MKPGRNDSCPCGSGKKYKHCCLLKAEAVSPGELTWRRVRRAIDPLAGELTREAARRFGEAGLEEAWDEFHAWEEDEPFDDGSPYVPLFFAWYVHDWLPDAADTEVPEAAHGKTASQAYLDRTGGRLDPIARRYVEACIATPFSFHEVIENRPGQGFRLRDVLLGTEADVFERSGSAYVETGDILFTKVVPIEGIHLLEGMAPVALPPVHKADLIEARKKLGTKGDLLGAETLRDWDLELREMYLAIADRLLNPQLPELRNTDGDPIEMHTLVFELDAPDAAFEALKDLAAGAPDEEVDEGVTRDAEGKLTRAEISWRRLGNKMHKDWDNTVLGTIRIEGKRMTAEVNSVRRAAALRKLIENRLGDTAHVKPTIVQSAQSLLSRKPSARERAESERRAKEHAEFAARPEVQQLMREQMRKHYRAWVDEKIPALGNRTPRKAVHDPDGREAVEALIAQIERDGERMQPPLDPEIVRELRETLGLAVPR